MIGVSPALESWRRLLRDYHALLDTSWWDGRRERLVAEMEAAWKRLSGPEREAAQKYQWELYEQRIRDR